jgi:hypothetical protein
MSYENDHVIIIDRDGGKTSIPVLWADRKKQLPNGKKVIHFAADGKTPLRRSYPAPTTGGQVQAMIAAEGQNYDGQAFGGEAIAGMVRQAWSIRSTKIAKPKKVSAMETVGVVLTLALTDDDLMTKVLEAKAAGRLEAFAKEYIAEQTELN